MKARAHSARGPAGPTSRRPASRRAGAAVVPVMGRSVPCAPWARAFIEEWPDLDCAVVINRLGRGGETTRAQLADLVGRPISLELPCSPALRDAEDDGRLVSLKWTRYGRAITRLADALVIR